MTVVVNLLWSCSLYIESLKAEDHATCRYLAAIRSRLCRPGLRNRNAGRRVIRMARALRSFVSPGPSPRTGATASARSSSRCIELTGSRLQTARSVPRRDKSIGAVASRRKCWRRRSPRPRAAAQLDIAVTPINPSRPGRTPQDSAGQARQSSSAGTPGFAVETPKHQPDGRCQASVGTGKTRSILRMKTRFSVHIQFSV